MTPGPEKASSRVSIIQHLGEDSRFVGMTVRSTEAGRIHRLLVVAVKPRDGQMVFNPDADYTFAKHDTVIIIGRENDIDRFRTEHLPAGGAL